MKIMLRLIASLIALGMLAACAMPAPTLQPVAPTTATIATGAPRPAETRAAESSSTSARSATTAVQKAATVPDIRGVFGLAITFATHAELESYGFAWGPSDGQFGAIPASGNNYIFYGTAGSTTSCAGSPSIKGSEKEGAFTFTGTLDHVTGSNGCIKLFGPGEGPAGWVFDKDYAGGGQVIRFSSGGKRGWLMPFHSEYHWSTSATSDHQCAGVPCFYGSLGLAISTDDAKTFKVVGQILQPSQPLSVFMGGGRNMPIGYGSFIVADANGKHLDNPPADPSNAYLYLFFTDVLPGSPGACNTGQCTGAARALYTDVIAAALSGDAHQVAKVFHKYDGASPNPWTQPATSDTPDMSGTAGKYVPLWSNDIGGAEVIYDRDLDVYLAVYQTIGGFKVRVSGDLIHWSEPIAAYTETSRSLYYPTFIGETSDPTIGGTAPRIYFSSFPVGQFPDWKTAIFESVPLMLSRSN